MNIEKKSLMNKIFAVLIIFALTMSDFLFVGASAVTYAVDGVTTNNSNVEFFAYFLNQEGEKVDEIENDINGGDLFLYVDVSVKNEGYFNGTLSLNNSNFNLKQEILSEGILEISGNTVALNKINAGSTATIKLGITGVTDNNINISTLNNSSEIVLEGKYVNSKNVENEKYIDIKGTSKVKINWVSNGETVAQVSSDVLTNSIYNINGETKRIVQLLVNSKITNNNYPIKNSTLTLSVPENVQNVEVYARSTAATNSNIQFDENNYTYDEATHTLTIKLSNEDESNISWNKNVQDTFIVTYTFDQNENVSNKEVTVNANIVTYDNKELQTTNNVLINEDIDKIVSNSVETEESAIYKGKLYTGEEREYKTSAKINVNYSDLVNNIVIKEDVSKYIVNDTEIQTNIVYKSTTINKDEFLSLFGEEGYITIKNSDGAVVANINKDTTADENGNITTNYGTGTKSVTFETSKPIALGTLNLINTKAILNTGLSREDVNNITAIKEKVSSNYNKNTYVAESTKQIELKNTTSQATLNVSTDKLSTVETSQNVKITAILENNGEDKDLYKNASIKITLPKQVTSVNAKCKLLYGNGLTLSNAKVAQENGNYVIKIDLAGEQTTYNTETLEGTTLIIYANMELNPLATDSEEEIKLNYTNEKATSFADNGEQTAKVKIESKAGIIAANNIQEYGITTIGEEETKDVAIAIAENEKIATIGIKVINNEGTKINNVKILGSFPTGENDNLGTKLTSGINLMSSQNVQVYYSSEENPTADLQNEANGWKTNGDANTAKSYLIALDSMETGETFEANYTINIPASLSYNMSTEEGYTVNYTNSLTEASKSVSATTLNLSTGAGAEIESTLKAYVGGKELAEGDTVYSGEIIKYELTLKNTGTKAAENINIEAAILENTTYMQYIKSTEVIEYENGEYATDSYQEKELTDNKLTKTIENLDINSVKTITYEVKINESEDNKNISSTIKLAFNGTENSDDTTIKEIKSVSNNVAKSDINLQMVMLYRTEEGIRAGGSYFYSVKVQNTSGKKLSNVEIKINTNSEFALECVTDNEENIVPSENSMFKIDSIEDGETKEFTIEVIASKESGKAQISALANDKYHSNEISENVNLEQLEVSMSSKTEGETVKDGDEIDYLIKIKNNGDVPVDYLTVSQTLSKYLNVKKVMVNGQEIEFMTNSYSDLSFDVDENGEPISNPENKDEEVIENNASDIETYNIEFAYENTLSKDEVLDIEVETTSDSNFIHNDNLYLTSFAEVMTDGLALKTEQINHIITSNLDADVKIKEDEENPSGGDSNNNNQSTNSGDKHIISGIAWLDVNENGQRDADEQTLSGITVNLLNLDNNTMISTTTADNGFYSFTDTANGKYIVIFDYDKDAYVLTTYQAEGVQGSRNSDVENVTLTIDGEEKNVSATDTITVNDSNIANIDIGLIEAKIFDLELTKTISKISISNASGTKTTEYSDATLAKAEIKSKYLSSSTVVIEYKITVKNNGEVAGYAKNIVDYKPTDLSFNSSLNSDWYQSGDYIYSKSLANTRLEAGETKELTLVLTKTMTNSNTGLVNNTAEIAEDYNNLGIADTDSTPGNKQTGEDDMGSSDVIISVGTGAAISYIALTLSIIIIIAVGAYIVSKKILKDNIKI